jgi:uncharacterized membrane protein
VGGFLAFFGSQAVASCGQGNFANCGTVIGSAWGTLFDLPTALFACAFYASLALALTLASQRKNHASGATLLLLAGVGATLFSAFLAYQSKVVLGEWCTFCISLYAVAVLCLLAGLSAVKAEEPDPLKEALFSKGGGLTGPALLLFLAVIGLGVSQKADPHDHAPGDGHGAANLESLYSHARSALKISGKEPVKGSVKAEWTLVEFTDYSCGHCAEQAGPIQELIEAHPNAKLLHKHYAFIQEASTLAALAANCAHKQGRFWEMNEVLFDNMKDWTRDDLLFVAKDMLHLDEAAFSDCMEDPATQRSIEEDYTAGERAGVRATPSIFLSFDGATWLKMEAGPEGAELLLKAAESGTALPGFSPDGSDDEEPPE